MTPPPIANAYWVAPNLLAGEYPAFVDEDAAPARLEAILDAGITLFLDLTVAGEYSNPSYEPLLQAIATRRAEALQYVRMAIGDMRTPTVNFMYDIQHTLQVALERGDKVYVHCLGGIGRTGTVIGCHLVETGCNGEQALAEIARLRQGIPSAARQSPETRAQKAMVLNWKPEKMHAITNL